MRILNPSVLCMTILSILPFSSEAVKAAMLDPAREIGLVPHKALYSIELSSKKSGLRVSNITGQMIYQWQPSCHAWVSQHQFDMLYEYVEMPAMHITSEYATYEAFDGSDYSFSSQRKNDQIVFEEIRGNVDANSGDQQVAIYSLPPSLEYDLPENTKFPMAHTIDVLKQIQNGKHFYKSTLFDGSDTEGPVFVNSFLGKPKPYVPNLDYQSDISETLVTDAFYPLHLAFFPLDSKEGAAEYEMSIDFHENGVISAVTVDYEDFSLDQELIALEPMSDLCEQKKNIVEEDL